MDTDELVGDAVGSLVTSLLDEPVIIDGMMVFTDGTILTFTDDTLLYFGD